MTVTHLYLLYICTCLYYLCNYHDTPCSACTLAHQQLARASTIVVNIFIFIIIVFVVVVVIISIGIINFSITGLYYQYPCRYRDTPVIVM